MCNCATWKHNIVIRKTYPSGGKEQKGLINSVSKDIDRRINKELVCYQAVCLQLIILWMSTTHCLSYVSMLTYQTAISNYISDANVTTMYIMKIQ